MDSGFWYASGTTSFFSTLEVPNGAEFGLIVEAAVGSATTFEILFVRRGADGQLEVGVTAFGPNGPTVCVPLQVLRDTLDRMEAVFEDRGI